MSTLTSLLARDGAVSLDTIEQALQRQVLEGGELDTALLELGALSENVLGAYRAASFQMPAAPRAQLEHGDDLLYARVPAALARELRVVPVGTAGDALVLATDVPLTVPNIERLSRELGTRVSFRIATELRVQSLLAERYAAEMPSRMRLLADRLRATDAGALCEVSPWSKADSAPPSRGSNRPVRGATVPLGMPATPVRVMKVVSLGERRTQTSPDALETRPLRPNKPPLQSRRPRHSSSMPRGPITRLAVIELLVKARDRDRVLDVFFAFARQYFECTVLFALRDERLLGIAASGLPPPIDASALESPVAHGGAVQALMQTRKPQVLDLRANAADHSLVEALGRAHGQPCAIIPVSIRQRNVALLYGDRSGEPLVLTDISELIQTLPSVSAAFERLIQERKLQALDAGRTRSPAGAEAAPPEKPPEGAFRPTPPAAKQPAAPAAPPVAAAPVAAAPAPAAAPAAQPIERGIPRGYAPKSRTAPGVTTRREPAPAPEPEPEPMPLPSVGANVLQAPRVPAEAMLSGAELNDALTTNPTIQIPTDDIERGMRPSSPPSSTSYSARSAPLDDMRVRRREQERTRPDRPSKLPLSRATKPSPARPRRRSDPPSPRTLSQPPPGTGSYAVRDAASEKITMHGIGSDPAPPEKKPPERELTRAANAPLPPPPALPSASSERVGLHQRPERITPRSDPRREEETAEPPTSEVVSIPPAVRESLRPARMTPPQEAPPADVSGDAERLVGELVRLGPDEEQPTVAALLRVGDAALPVLARRFPGPLWFERGKPRQRMPAGRDVSAIARALHAFEARATPVIAQLLNAPQAEVRLCATLLAADLVSAELLGPLSHRLFDPDGQVRLIAIESLPAYRNTRGFEDVKKSLRETAQNAREPIPSRLAALEAISVLRDANSVPVLADLCSHDNRQLSVPAHRSLVAITAQDFGDSDRKWKTWFEKNRTRQRAEWLIDGLTHGEERVRTTAGLELQKLSQVYYGFSAAAPKRDRERVQKRYQQWWDTQGKKLKL